MKKQEQNESLMSSSPDQLDIFSAISEEIAEDEVCEYCDGEGFVTIQTAPDDEITRRCICTLDEWDEDDDSAN